MVLYLHNYVFVTIDKILAQYKNSDIYWRFLSLPRRNRKYVREIKLYIKIWQSDTLSRPVLSLKVGAALMLVSFQP